MQMRSNANANCQNLEKKLIGKKKSKCTAVYVPAYHDQVGITFASLAIGHAIVLRQDNDILFR